MKGGRREEGEGGREEGPSLTTCNSVLSWIIVITTGHEQPADGLYLSRMIFKDMLSP